LRRKPAQDARPHARRDARHSLADRVGQLDGRIPVDVDPLTAVPQGDSAWRPTRNATVSGDIVDSRRCWARRAAGFPVRRHIARGLSGPIVRAMAGRIGSYALIAANLAMFGVELASGPIR
jgi:hypothetical protein